LDTGATCSAITPNLSRTIACDKKVLERVTKVWVTGTDTLLSSQHLVVVDFTLENGCKIQQEVLVIKGLSHDMMLGVDFLSSLKAFIDLHRKTLEINDGTGPTHSIRLRNNDGTTF